MSKAKKDEPRVSVRARVCADAIGASGADRVVTLDLHASQIQEFFKVPADDLYAVYVLCTAIIEREFDNLIVVAPDAGFARRLASTRMHWDARWPPLTSSAANMARIQDSRISSLVVTNSVETQPESLCDKIHVASVAPLFGEAIRRIHHLESISVLFEET